MPFQGKNVFAWNQLQPPLKKSVDFKVKKVYLPYVEYKIENI